MIKAKYVIVFYQHESGRQPVKVWLKKLDNTEKSIISEDIETLALSWPIGMPLVRYLENSIWELRSNLKNRISRILFIVDDKNIVLLHGFIKKTEKTPRSDIEIAKERIKNIESYGYA